MPAIAALLESRAALTSLRRSLPRGGPRVVTCRNSSALQRLMENRLIDAVVLAPQPLLSAAQLGETQQLFEPPGRHL